ncbi:YbaB/EbfC family nucleoid-associated protein [Streptomyces sp. NPDC007983]|uniref:YbaB/EbfC family nucleoid-associated protein n=1 Tax=Streptomyces sp. NPDC007983 TaxID=3364800 RepID=UPI0036EDACAC
MTDDIFRGMREFQQYAEQLQQLMTDMQEQIPQHAVGEDVQGAVTVQLGPDKLPESIKVASDWERRQSPDGLGQAVFEAYESALRELMEGWSRSLEQTGWEERAERIDKDFELSESSASPPIPQWMGSQGAHQAVHRPAQDAIEDTLSAFEALERLDTDSFQPPEVRGESAARRVIVAVTPQTLVSCEIDPQWASKQSTVRLNQALSEALNNARAKLATTQSPGAAGASNLGAQGQGLMSEFLAMLNDPQQLR